MQTFAPSACVHRSPSGAFIADLHLRGHLVRVDLGVTYVPERDALVVVFDRVRSPAYRHLELELAQWVREHQAALLIQALAVASRSA